MFFNVTRLYPRNFNRLKLSRGYWGIISFYIRQTLGHTFLPVNFVGEGISGALNFHQALLFHLYILKKLNRPIQEITLAENFKQAISALITNWKLILNSWPTIFQPYNFLLSFQPNTSTDEENNPLARKQSRFRVEPSNGVSDDDVRPILHLVI